MSDTSKILVLVADETSGTLSANDDGNTRLLRSIARVTPSNDSRTSQEARKIFACQLMMALSRDVDAQDYDGVIIFAEAPMMWELRRAQTAQVSRLMIAQIVGRSSDAGYGPGRAAANAENAYRGAMG